LRDFQHQISSEEEQLSSASVSLAHSEDQSQITTDTEHLKPVLPDEAGAKLTKQISQKVVHKKETKLRKPVLKPEVNKQNIQTCKIILWVQSLF
jgi:hypothetical protein